MHSTTIKSWLLVGLTTSLLATVGCGQSSPDSSAPKGDSKPAASASASAPAPATAPANAANNSAKIDGKAWQGDDANSSFKTGNTDKGAPALFIKVVKGDPAGKYEGFNFTPASEPKVGEFKLDGNTCQYHRSEPSDDNLNATGGTLKITKADAKHLEGTFELEAATWDKKTTVKVTEGHFSVNLKD